MKKILIPMKNKLFLFLYILTITFINGCTTTETNETITITQPLTSTEGIVLLSDLLIPSMEYSDKAVDKCLGKWLRNFNPKLKFIAASEFRKKLYPYFSISTQPRTVNEYQNLFNNPLVQERIKAMQVRYLIVQQAKTNSKIHGIIVPIGGPQAAGFFGLMWWNRHSAFNAQIWDLTTGSSKGHIKTIAKGTGILPAFIFPVPLYLPATEKATCKELAEHIASALHIK